MSIVISGDLGATAVGDTATQTLTNKTLTSPVITGTQDLQGGQIKFPATQVPSADANTLDDYEEGTWTPVLYGATSAGTGTYTSQTGSYTKIGRMVCWSLVLQWTAQTGTGNMRISGFPFTAITGKQYMSGLDFATLTIPASQIPYAVLSTNIIYLNTYQTGASDPLALAMDVSATIYISGTCEVQ